MRTSDSLDKLLPALTKARLDFGEVKKSKSNKHFGSDYAGLDDYIAAVDKPLAAQGLVLTSAPVSEPDGGLVLVTRLYHESGQFLECSLPMRDDGNPQHAGSMITYYRRFSLAALLGVTAEGDDDDGEAATRYSTEEKRSTPKRLSGTRRDASQSEPSDKKVPEKDARATLMGAILASLKTIDDRETRRRLNQEAFGCGWDEMPQRSIADLQAGYVTLQGLLPRPTNGNAEALATLADISDLSHLASQVSPEAEDEVTALLALYPNGISQRLVKEKYAALRDALEEAMN